MPAGTRHHVEVEGKGIAIFNVHGTFFALRDTCPHRGARLSAGTIVGSIKASRPGCYEYDPSQKFIKCPWHGWEYDLETGQSWFDPKNHRVRAFPVTIEGGDTLLAGNASTDPVRRLPGPYIAETVQVIVEDDYVVVEL
jgi:3-phenylpropionate/trans-cinnamate dioxygenase ferredoxin subunit